MPTFQLVDCRKDTGLEDVQTQEGETLGQFLMGRFEGEGEEFFEDLLVKANRQSVNPNEYRPQDGDFVTVSPTNVSGE